MASQVVYGIFVMRKREKPLFITQLQSVDQFQCELNLPRSIGVRGAQERRRHPILRGKDIDSNRFSRFHKLGRIALKTILCDLNALVVAIKQVE